MTLRRGESYSAEKYAEKLSAFKPDVDRSLIGMVKPGATPGAILYAHPASCEQWVELPLDHIATIEHLGTSTCGDHAHARARISFVESDDAAHNSLLALALLHQNAGQKMAVAKGDFPVCPPGQHPCYDASSGSWTCCNG